VTTGHATPTWRTPGVPALLAMTMAGFSGYAVLLPVVPLWAAHGGAGSTGAGAANGVLLLLTVITQSFVPGMLRKRGWGPVLLTGMLLLGLPSLGHMASQALLPTLVLCGVRGVGFGVLTVAAASAIAELVPASQRGAAIGAYGLAVAGPQVFLMPLAPWASEFVGFWLVFVVGAIPVLGCVAAFPLARALRRAASPRDVGRPPTSLRARNTTYRRLLGPMLILSGATLAGGVLVTFTPQMTGSSVVAGQGLVVFTAMAALCRWRIGSLADKYGAQPFLWPLILVTALGLAFTAFGIADPADTRVLALLPGMAMVGVGYGGLQNLTLYIAFQRVERHDFGVASAVWNGVFDVGMGLGAVLAGIIAAETSFSLALAAGAAYSFATLPVALQRTLLGRQRQRN
jgi:MFS family permease